MTFLQYRQKYVTYNDNSSSLFRHFDLNEGNFGKWRCTWHKEGRSSADNLQQVAWHLHIKKETRSIRGIEKDQVCKYGWFPHTKETGNYFVKRDRETLEMKTKWKQNGRRQFSTKQQPVSLQTTTSILWSVSKKKDRSDVAAAALDWPAEVLLWRISIWYRLSIFVANCG